MAIEEIKVLLQHFLSVNFCGDLWALYIYRIAPVQSDFDTSYLRFIERYEDKNTTVRFSVIISPHS